MKVLIMDILAIRTVRASSLGEGKASFPVDY